MVTNLSGSDLYFQRMTHSIGDKKRILPYLKGPRVMDIGCGSGDLMHVISDLGYDSYGIDASPESVARAGGDHVRLGYADEITKMFGPESFDTIICCSLFHEVFSYGNRDGQIGKVQNLITTFEDIRTALKPGGRLIIRDGVAPTGPDLVTMTIADDEAVKKFLRHSPFAGENDTDRRIDLVQTAPHTWQGNMSSVMEFAYTYTWGENSFEREVQELYGVNTLDAYAYLVESSGFVCEEKFSYLQPGYPAHLEGKVQLDAPFPDSNAIWVFTKTD